jgi:hypothetical protein
MGDSPDLGAVDSTGAAYGYEGLYCIDSSIIPTSLGVNPSLTIPAVSERCAGALVSRADDLGLPARPPGLQPGVPEGIVGERVISPAPTARRAAPAPSPPPAAPAAPSPGASAATVDWPASVSDADPPRSSGSDAGRIQAEPPR